jgi:membrane-associated HD superfamily phosphohydrolase
VFRSCAFSHILSRSDWLDMPVVTPKCSMRCSTVSHRISECSIFGSVVSARIILVTILDLVTRKYSDMTWLAGVPVCRRIFTNIVHLDLTILTENGTASALRYVSGSDISSGWYTLNALLICLLWVELTLSSWALV